LHTRRKSITTVNAGDRPIQLLLFGLQDHEPERRHTIARKQPPSDTASPPTPHEIEDSRAAVSRARETLDRLQAEDLLHPRAVDLNLESLGSALMEVPVLSKHLESRGQDTLWSILEQLVFHKFLRASALRRLETIELLLQDITAKISDENFNDEAVDVPLTAQLESVVNAFYDDISALLDRLE
jgi:hypothetical protein